MMLALTEHGHYLTERHPELEGGGSMARVKVRSHTRRKAVKTHQVVRRTTYEVVRGHQVWVQAEKDAKPKRRSPLEDALAGEGTVYRPLPDES
jgi:hypothetical protein